MKKNILYLFVPFCIKSNPASLQNNIYDNNLYSQTKLLSAYPIQDNQNLKVYEFNKSSYPVQNCMPTNTQGYFVNNIHNQNELLTVLERYYSILSENFNTLNNKVLLKKKKEYNDCVNWKKELDFLYKQFMLLKNGVKDLLELVLQNPSELERNYSNSILTSIEKRTLVLEKNILILTGQLNKKIIKLTKRNLTKSQWFFSKIFS